MKVVIIGGGIAGLTFGILLKKRNIDVVINERSVGMPVRGHAFLMHNDGLAILKEMNPDKDVPLPGNKINSFSLRRAKRYGNKTHTAAFVVMYQKNRPDTLLIR